MPPKKLKLEEEKTKDIRQYFKGKENMSETKEVPGCSTPRKAPPVSTEPQAPTNTQMRIKDENDGDSPVKHHIKVKFNPSSKEYNLACSKQLTVLEAIKSHPVAPKMIKCADENLIIQMGKKDKETIVATHFPYSCVPHGEHLIVSKSSEKVEEVQDHFDKTVHPKDAYSVFYIDTTEGKNTPKRGLFRSKEIRTYKFLCVYGRKGITVEEALRRDGRLLGDFGSLELSDNENPDLFTMPSQSVDILHEKKFKICRPRRKQVSGEKNVGSILDLAKTSGRSVVQEMEQSGSRVSIEEIYERLRQQFPDLKEWMESRFPRGSYQKKLNLGKENFGKIQQSFSEVHRLKKILEMGKSVCKIVVENLVSLGTGFVWFGNFIVTNAHLFQYCRKGNELNVNVFVLFNYDDPEPETNYFYFTAEKTFVDLDVELDYAILKLNDGKKPNRAGNIKVPPGLMEKLGPLPENGEACIVGHPAGQVKQIDPTFIIAPEQREQAVCDHLNKYKHSMFTVLSIIQQIKERGIENIMIGNNDVGTYHTFMYHSASGSPVFDAHCQPFGLHTAGYSWNHLKDEPGVPRYVIEFAQPLLSIFQRFVLNLKESGRESLLKEVEEAAAGNPYLIKILQEEPMEVD